MSGKDYLQGNVKHFHLFEDLFPFSYFAWSGVFHGLGATAFMGYMISNSYFCRSKFYFLIFLDYVIFLARAAVGTFLFASLCQSVRLSVSLSVRFYFWKWKLLDSCREMKFYMLYVPLIKRLKRHQKWRQPEKWRQPRLSLIVMRSFSWLM